MNDSQVPINLLNVPIGSYTFLEFYLEHVEDHRLLGGFRWDLKELKISKNELLVAMKKLLKDEEPEPENVALFKNIKAITTPMIFFEVKGYEVKLKGQQNQELTEDLLFWIENHRFSFTKVCLWLEFELHLPYKPSVSDFGSNLKSLYSWYIEEAEYVKKWITLVEEEGLVLNEWHWEHAFGYYKPLWLDGTLRLIEVIENLRKLSVDYRKHHIYVGGIEYL